MSRFDPESRSLRLPWGDGETNLRLPERWGDPEICEPSPLPAVPDPVAEVRRAIGSPIGSRRLGELARPGTRVALVIDDASRPTPVAPMLQTVVEELMRSGVQRRDITVVVALGVHRPMEKAEFERRVGAACADLSWENHDCDDHARLDYLGVTRRGTRVLVNRTVAGADLVVSIGCIEPHLIASFGGGYKNLVPGVAARETIAANHALNCTPATFNMVGRPVEGNPMRLDLEEAGRMLKTPVFIVNAVLNGSLEVTRIVAGDAVSAQRAGAEVTAATFGVPMRGPVDVLIADSHPMDQDLRQGSKALANTIHALRPGGACVILMRATEGVGVFGLADRRLPIGRGMLKRLAPLLAPLVARLKLAGVADDERLFLYFALQAMRRGRLIVCAPTIPEDKRRSFPFAELVATPEEAIARAAAHHHGAASVAVFPHGGSTFPILPDPRSGT